MKEIYDKSVEATTENILEIVDDAIGSLSDAEWDKKYSGVQYPDVIRKQIQSHTLFLIDEEIEQLLDVEGEHTYACGNSPLLECNPDCPQKALTDHITHLKEQRELISNQGS